MPHYTNRTLRVHFSPVCSTSQSLPHAITSFVRCRSCDCSGCSVLGREIHTNSACPTTPTEPCVSIFHQCALPVSLSPMQSPRSSDVDPATVPGVLCLAVKFIRILHAPLHQQNPACPFFTSVLYQSVSPPCNHLVRPMSILRLFRVFCAWP